MYKLQDSYKSMTDDVPTYGDIQQPRARSLYLYYNVANININGMY